MQKKSELSVRRQCELLGINRSSIYTVHQQMPDKKHLFEELLMSRIDYWHTVLPCSGTRKIVQLLKDEGFRIGRKLIRRLMHSMGLRVIYPKPNLSRRDFKSEIMPYLLREMDIMFPNQVWSIDITYIKLNHHHMYLTAIIDWFTRRIMNWELSDTLDTANVIKAVSNAVEKHGVPAIINSDQGSQFTSIEYKSFLKSLSIRQSMDGKSRWADNVRIERWFRSLKTELIYINEFSNPRELRIGIDEYVNQYNSVRPHEALEMRTPDEVYNRYFNVA